MELSVIIVNYNVRSYLEQCLRSVRAAMAGIAGEVFVVDNQSSDGSVAMVQERFPEVRLIMNKENVGFSRANNQAIRQTQGRYVLLLNPDTIVGEDVFRKVIDFMDAHPDAGGLGVKMIDGTGRFLPESKRGLPTPQVAFFKIIGLARLFPKSRLFGRYHLGHMPENTTARIQILSGACMFLRRATLDRVGLLDEHFFMYGEDIDLSYRINLGGFENYYFPEARILHYKGESTKKSSVNYVFVFYNAMAIFARKHFTRKRPDLFSWLIAGSIYLSATGAILARFLIRAILPMLDGLGLVAAYLLLVRTGGMGPRPVGPWLVSALVVLVQALFGGYDKPVRLDNMLRGVLATMALGVGWMLFRTGGLDVGVVLLGGMMLAALLTATRLLLHALHVRGYALRPFDRRRVIAVGTTEEANAVMALLWQTHYGLARQRIVGAENLATPQAARRLRRMVTEGRYDELVLCAKDLPWGTIITAMESFRDTGVAFKVAQPDHGSIIGPSSIESLQDLYILPNHSVQNASSRRLKRIVDLAMALLLAVSAPIGIWFVHRKSEFLRNIGRVLTGERTWVGYHGPTGPEERLPRLRHGVIDPLLVEGVAGGPQMVERVNLAYAKDYRALQDLSLILRGFPLLGGA
ncbi:MAG: glycosyltransferase [Flavobacteriales bacterium]|nr:glycosyltransferase [Flavobacteriales bacterium]MCB9168648.1 glycosyltransferase [Flavobacteriales bacterium]